MNYESEGMGYDCASQDSVASSVCASVRVQGSVSREGWALGNRRCLRGWVVGVSLGLQPCPHVQREAEKLAGNFEFEATRKQDKGERRHLLNAECS